MNLFEKVIGQDEAKQHLYKAIKLNRLAHSYLIVGEDGLGGIPLALEVARTLNCPRGVEVSAYEDCDCPSCKRMKLLQHPNLMFLVPLPPPTSTNDETIQARYQELISVWVNDPYGIPKLSGSGQIVIDYVRELRCNLNLAFDEFGMRCIIVYPSDRLNENAANTLLKLLEEPPERCLFFLITESPRDLLPTIVSRCQQIVLKPLSYIEVKNALMTRKNASEEIADCCARISGGNYSRALKMLDQEIKGYLNEGLQFLRAAVTHNHIQISELIDNWSDKSNRFEIIERLKSISAWLQDALLIKALPIEEASTRIINFNDIGTVNKIAGRYTPEQLTQILQEVEETRLALEANVVSQYALMALAIEIHRIMR